MVRNVPWQESCGAKPAELAVIRCIQAFITLLLQRVEVVHSRYITDLSRRGLPAPTLSPTDAVGVIPGFKHFSQAQH